MKRSEPGRAGTDAFASLDGSRLDGSRLDGSRLDGSSAGPVPFGDVALAAGQRLGLVPGFGVLWVTAGAGHFRSIEPGARRVPPARLEAARGGEAPAIVPLERGALLLFVAGAPGVGSRHAQGSTCVIAELVARASLEAHAWSLDVARSPALLARELPPARAIAAPELSRQQPLATLLQLLASEPSPAVRDCLLEALLLCAWREPHATAQAGSSRMGTPQGAPLHDRAVARALALLQKDLGRRWSVDELGAAVGLSRAALARRFVAALGEPPLRLQARLRLERAARLLERTDASLAEVAAQVGYESEFAFSRAFRRRYGVAPGAHRQRARALESARTRALAVVVVGVGVGSSAPGALRANDSHANEPCANEHDARANEQPANDGAATCNAAPAPQPTERRVIGFLRPHGANALPPSGSASNAPGAASPSDAARAEGELETLHVVGRVLPDSAPTASPGRAEVRTQASARFTRTCAGSRAA